MGSSRTVDVTTIEAAIDRPFADWAKDCHSVSLAIVRSGVYPGARVARGFAEGVRSQHSWVTLGDPYDREATIIDPTLWSYRDDVSGVWTGTLEDGIHHPHGEGHIFQWGRPLNAEESAEEAYEPEGLSELSRAARGFIDVIGPLGPTGWHQLAHAPVEGWPAAEIFSMLDDDPVLRAVVPIDILGMVTDRNPGGLYLREEEVSA